MIFCAAVCGRHDSSTARSVCMRDMGTEMTPIASQEPSRTGTPIRSTTPARSPNSSRKSSPVRSVSTEETDRKESSKKDVQMKIREEIKVLGTQLGKKNIAAWADGEQEEKDRSTSFKKNVIDEQPQQSVAEIRATAWEEAEKAKYLARFCITIFFFFSICGLSFLNIHIEIILNFPDLKGKGSEFKHGRIIRKH